jgi:chromosome partitioning protein
MILSLVGLKGGVGKTTSAAFMAAALHERGREVQVFDADPQRSLIRWAELAGFPMPVDAWPPTRGGFPGDVVIDTPPTQHASVVVENVLRSSTHVVVPMAPTAAEFERMATLRELFDDVAAHAHVAVLLVRTVANAASTEVYREGLEAAGWRVLRGVVPRRETFAQSWGGPIVRASSTGYGDAVAELRPSPVALEVQA